MDLPCRDLFMKRAQYALKTKLKKSSPDQPGMRLDEKAQAQHGKPVPLKWFRRTEEAGSKGSPQFSAGFSD